MKRILPVGAAIWLALGSHLFAQTPQVSPTASSGGAAAKADGTPPLSASDQAEWVKGRVAAAELSSVTYAKPAFAQRVAAAGLPPETAAEFSDLASRQLDLWQATKASLDQIAAQESVSAHESPPSPPTSEEEAAALSAKIRAEQLRATRAAEVAENTVRDAAAARQTERKARQDFLSAEEAAKADGTPAEKEAASLKLDLAKERLGVEEAKVFQLQWAIYAAQLEQKLAETRSLGASAALAKSAFAKLLDADRAKARIAALESEIKAGEKEEGAAASQEEKLASEIAELQKKAKAAESQNKSGLTDLRQALLTKLETGRRQEALRSAHSLFLDLVDMEKALVGAALSASSSGELAALHDSRAIAEDQRAELRSVNQRLESRSAEAESTAKAIEAELASSSLPAPRRDDLQRLLDTANKEAKTLAKLRDRASSIASLQAQLISELDARIRERDLSERAIQKGRDLLSRVMALWNFPIFETGDSVLTPGKIIVALLGLGLAIFISGLFSQSVAGSLVRRFRLPLNQAHLVRTLLYYLLCAILVLTTLQVLHIPLTIFAFLGGALMVGIGFGSQNLMNNFISGLILLLERKFNVGDLVEADGHFGRVTHLGSRCCSIRRPDGVEVLVPNSFLLEKNVTNWTLSDPDHRFDFAVGVAYDSPVEKVLSILEKVAKDHPEVLKEPAPLAIFENFGDSALVFRVFFWLRMGLSDGRIVGSQLRAEIDRLFRESGIAMPFPQRDVNLNLSADAAKFFGARGDSLK